MEIKIAFDSRLRLLQSFSAARGGRIAIDAAPPRYMGKMHCIICFPLKNESFMDAKEMHGGARMPANQSISRSFASTKKKSKPARYPPSASRVISAIDSRPDIGRACLPKRHQITTTKT
jgi:hypothetical protein